MKATRHIILCVVGFLMMTITSRAQDREPLLIGNFDTQGSATFGYRFTNVTGSQNKYRELFNLREGARLMDFSLFGHAAPGASRFADRYSFTMSGMGGDPYPMTQLTVSKDKLYELRVNFRQAYYQWNRDDTVALPTALSTSTTGFDRGLSANHDWATVRRFGDVSFLLHATNNLRFGFEYHRNTRDGLTYTTRSLEYTGSPSSWGSFARGVPYYVVAPVNEVSNRVTGSIDYSYRDWNFHYRLGYQTFEQNITANNLDWPDMGTSINVDLTGTVNGVPDTPVAPNMPALISFQDSRRLKTPVSEFSYDGKVNDWLDIRGGYIFYRYSGPVSRDALYSGIYGTNNSLTLYAPFTVQESDRAMVTDPNHVIDQGFTVRLRDWWRFLVDYRYSRIATESGDGLFQSVFNGGVLEPEIGQERWKVGTHTLNLNMEFIPTPQLIIRPGIRLMKEDVVGLVLNEAGELEADDVHTRRIKTAWPTLSVYYKPSRMFSVRGDIQDIVTGTSYTRITPHTDVGSRIVFRFQPSDKLSVEDNLTVRNRKLSSAEFQNNIRSNGITVTYAFTDRISAFGGFSYDTYLAKGYTEFIRGSGCGNPDGTPPGVPCRYDLLDSYINRIWQGGLAVRAPKYVGANVSGNFVRTTGVSLISGEPPISGPRTFPMITGTLWAEYPRIGRLSIDLQRTYYIERLVTADNFQANVVMVRWTTDF
jgi:hypothetical protein